MPISVAWSLFMRCAVLCSQHFSPICHTLQYTVSKNCDFSVSLSDNRFGVTFAKGAVSSDSIIQSACGRTMCKGKVSICSAIHLPIYLSNYPSIHPYIHPSIDLSANPSVVPSAFPFIRPVSLYHISVHGSLLVTYSSICLAIIIYPSICPCIHPKICLPLCLLGHW